ncbi:MAG: hypothetical protein CM1200mP3_01440 [Chloroflexota bacterium]|nr:MAG: hypothetical protein CM1200mP3_01440 [Chloroflexota bacterium]
MLLTTEYQIKKNEMKTRLMSILENENDPRVTESPSGSTYHHLRDRYPKNGQKKANVNQRD